MCEDREASTQLSIEEVSVKGDCLIFTVWTRCLFFLFVFPLVNYLFIYLSLYLNNTFGNSFCSETRRVALYPPTSASPQFFVYYDRPDWTVALSLLRLTSYRLMTDSIGVKPKYHYWSKIERRGRAQGVRWGERAGVIDLGTCLWDKISLIILLVTNS